MDALAGLLEGPRARGAFLLRALLEAPWSMRVQDQAPLTLIAPTKGNTWVTPSDGAALGLRPGDIGLFRGPDPYVLGDDPATPPTMIVQPGGRATTLQGQDLCDAHMLGVRTWGDPQGSVAILIGTYQMRGEVSERLLSALPSYLTMPGESLDSPLLRLLDEEVGKDFPGQEVVLDRLLDLLIIAVLRAWFSRPETEAPAWYRAHGDPVVGHALRLLHQHPEHPWTVASLASAIGVSRASLARRFTELVGEAPMTYLTDWRLTLAADLLRDPDITIGTVARQVGYGSSFALSAAFKRVRGVSPQQHRLRVPAG